MTIPKLLYLREPNQYFYEAMPEQIWEESQKVNNKSHINFGNISLAALGKLINSESTYGKNAKTCEHLIKF